MESTPVHSLQFSRSTQTVTIGNNVWLAPIASWSDAGFRSVCLAQGAGLCFTEMVSAEGCLRAQAKTMTLVKKAENEIQYGIQIFGASPAAAALAVQELNAFRPVMIDLNCGCSVAKILKSRSGAYLLQYPDLIAEIIKAMRDVTDSLVSLKIRSGYDDNTINFLQVSEKAQKAGANLITLHPRTRKQGFKGNADWTQVAELKKNSSVPVFGSGDLFIARGIIDRLASGWCDGVMLARGALGNPFLFSEILALAWGKDPPFISVAEKLETALIQLEISAAIKGERLACREMRKHFCAYIKGFSGASSLRQSLVCAQTIAEYRDILKPFTDKLPQN